MTDEIHKPSKAWDFVREFSGIVSLTALAFGSAYVVGFLNLVVFVSTLGIPSDAIRQDPISIASGVLFLVLPAYLVLGMWRGAYETYKPIDRFLERWRPWPALILLVLAAGIMLFYWQDHRYDWVAVGATIFFLTAWLGAPVGLTTRRRLVGVAVILLIAAPVLFGWSRALNLRYATYPTPHVSLVTYTRVPGLMEQRGSTDHLWEYPDLLFAYQDLLRVYVIADRGPDARVYAIPLEVVQSMRLWSASE